MDIFKWAWVLFVAASLAIVIRLAIWILPDPGERSQKVATAAESAAAAEPVEPEAPARAAPEPPAEEAAEAAAAEAAPVEPPAPPVVAVPPPVPPEPPPPEEFHLRRIRWGMTPAEVRSAEREPPARASDNTLLYSTTTLEMPCLLTYSFGQGRLVRARMAFSDPAGQDIPPLSAAQAQRRFLYLREQLRSRYGEPVQQTTRLPRDVSDLRRGALKQEELAKQYDVEIAEAEQRIRRQQALLETRFARWSNKAEMVLRGLKPYERDLRELRAWKQEALDDAAQLRRGIQERQEADAAKPLVATMSARWPYARELHDIELRLDLRPAVPRLDLRYEAAQAVAGWGGRDEL